MVLGVLIIDDKNNGLSTMEIKMLKERLSKESGRFGDRYCDLPVIGDVSQVDPFTNALKSCFLNEREIELWQSGCSFVDPWPGNIVRLID